MKQSSKRVFLTPGAARLIAEMLASCGNKSCDIAIKELTTAKKDVSLDHFWSKENKGWLKPVFGNLQLFAIEEGLVEIGTDEVVSYFGGRHHIAQMIRKATRSNLSFLMGTDAGLVLDVLLPLSDNVFKLDDFAIEFGDLVEAGGSNEGQRFVHRGLVVRAPVLSFVIEKISKEQRQSPEFMRALSRIKSPVRFPENYLVALEKNRIKKGSH